ncbi:Mov34/MPN/PAD-1 family protein [Chloroflexota bacterium]
MKIILPDALRNRIYEELQRAYPNEGGGFLLGQSNGRLVRIIDVTPVENIFEAGEQHHRYAMTPQDWVRLEDEAEARGLSLVGYFHSHPDSPAIPSVYDRDHALPNFVYIITQVQDAVAVKARAWRLAEDRSRFNECNLEIF